MGLRSVVHTKSDGLISLKEQFKQTPKDFGVKVKSVASKIPYLSPDTTHIAKCLLVQLLINRCHKTLLYLHPILSNCQLLWLLWRARVKIELLFTFFLPSSSHSHEFNQNTVGMLAAYLFHGDVHYTCAQDGDRCCPAS